MRFFHAARLNLATTFFIACMMLASVQHSLAEMACPVMLYSGKVDQGTLSVTFMNKGKVPIRQLELHCTPLQGHKASFNCHTEAGVFFPGTPYTISFSYPGKDPQTILVSLKSALLSDGDMWTSTHDQACHSLKIVRK